MGELDERMRSMEVKQAVADSAIMHLTDQATRHHNELLGKLEQIFIVLDQRPCAVHEEKFKNHAVQLAWMWFFTGAIVISLILAGVRSVFAH